MHRDSSATAAVSVRRRLAPSPTGFAPAATSASTSSGVKSPSGPTSSKPRSGGALPPPASPPSSPPRLPLEAPTEAVAGVVTGAVVAAMAARACSTSRSTSDAGGAPAAASSATSARRTCRCGQTSARNTGHANLVGAKCEEKLWRGDGRGKDKGGWEEHLVLTGQDAEQGMQRRPSWEMQAPSKHQARQRERGRGEELSRFCSREVHVLSRMRGRGGGRGRLGTVRWAPRQYVSAATLHLFEEPIAAFVPEH
eukprot:358772-Chlamydomonas_euryale.AAC.16